MPDSLGIPSPFVRSSGGKPDVRFRTLTMGGKLNFFGMIVLQFVGHPHCQYGI